MPPKYIPTQEMSEKILLLLSKDVHLLKKEEMEYINMVQENMGNFEFIRYFHKLKNPDLKRKFIFATFNWDEKMVTPTGTVPIVKKLIQRTYVEKAYAAWEWRDTDKETGLHTHVLLLGNIKEIMRYLKRLKGPFTKFVNNECKKYPMKYWNDKIKYVNGETFDEEKNGLKKDYEKLREKYSLPNLIK